MSYNSTLLTNSNSGLRYFGAQTLSLPVTDASDTLEFYATLQGVDAADKDIHFEIVTPTDGLDDNYFSDSIEFAMMPDNYFNFVNTSATMKKGENVAVFKVVFHPDQFDATKNFMVPVTTTNDANLTLSSNYGFVYFHLIGNPIAGPYTQEWIRFNNADESGSPAFDDTSDALFAPVNPTTIKVDSGTGVTYIITFENNAGVLSNFGVKFDAQSVVDAGITITGGPTILVADPANHHFEFRFTYNNSAGSPRVIYDKFK
jgi:hypothetical protein